RRRAAGRRSPARGAAGSGRYQPGRSGGGRAGKLALTYSTWLWYLPHHHRRPTVRERLSGIDRGSTSRGPRSAPGRAVSRPQPGRPGVVWVRGRTLSPAPTESGPPPVLYWVRRESWPHGATGPSHPRGSLTSEPG